MLHLLSTLTVSLLLTTSLTEAFTAVPSPPQSTRRSSSSSSSSSTTHHSAIKTSDVKEPEEMRHDIAVLRKQALERLEVLEHQMEELEAHQQQVAREASSLDSLEGTTTTTTTTKDKTTASKTPPVTKEKTTDKTATTATSPTATTTTTKSEQHHHEHLHSSAEPRTDHIPLHAPAHLLQDTRWKVAFNIGREPGTWMPAEWGASGDRLRLFVILDFTSESTSSDSSDDKDDDEFFAAGGSTQICHVVDAWVLSPCGQGQKHVTFDTNGAYHVAQGQGPAGTDLLRFAVNLQQDVHLDDDNNNNNSDVHVPAGRIYGTCGYFDTTPHSHAIKDGLAAEHWQLTRNYEELQRAGEMDPDLLHAMGRMKEQWKIRRELSQVQQKLLQARQQDPERAQLRLSRSGEVGLTREGGVCCKVHKGVAVEYRILGRMELGSMDKHDDDDDNNNEHGKDEVASKKLRP